jgi:flagellar biosynthesis/type III secretory pathway protein FliH
MSNFRPDWAERILRGRTKAYAKGFAKGYETGAKEMAEYLSQQIIYSINQDAVLRMTADIDTLERVVEVVEAVRDIGKAQS